MARISGMPVNRFFEEEVLRPLGMDDTWFVLPDSKIDIVSPVTAMPESEHDLFALSVNDENSYTALFPAGNCFATASDMARFYDVLTAGGMVDDVRWLSEQTVDEVTSCWADMTDEETGRRRRMGLGMRLAEGEFDKFGTAGEGSTFGHGGFGSCETWGDPGTQGLRRLPDERPADGRSRRPTPIRNVVGHTAGYGRGRRTTRSTHLRGCAMTSSGIGHTPRRRMGCSRTGRSRVRPVRVVSGGTVAGQRRRWPTLRRTDRPPGPDRGGMELSRRSPRTGPHGVSVEVALLERPGHRSRRGRDQIGA